MSPTNWRTVVYNTDFRDTERGQIARKHDRLVLVGADLEVKHVFTASTFRPGPVDRWDTIVLSQRRGDECIVPDGRPNDEEHVLPCERGIRTLHGSGRS